MLPGSAKLTPSLWGFVHSLEKDRRLKPSTFFSSYIFQVTLTKGVVGGAPDDLTLLPLPSIHEPSCWMSTAGSQEKRWHSPRGGWKPTQESSSQRNAP